AIPSTRAGLALYWRNNDLETLPWSQPWPVAVGLGKVDGVSMIQAAEGTPGLCNLWAAVTAAGTLWTLVRPDIIAYDCSTPAKVMVDGQAVTGVRGAPTLIQSTFGPGNFELFVPDAVKGLRHYWRVYTFDPDQPHVWRGPYSFAEQLGAIDGVAVC